MDFSTKKMRASGSLKLILLELSTVILVSCHSSEEGVFKSGESQKKPISELTAKSGPSLGASSGDSDVKVVASATYGIRVKSNSGARLCEGEVELQIMSNFTINYPQAEVRCLSIKINLGGILASVGSNITDGGELKSDGMMLSIKKIAGAEFSPPRPVLLGPIVQDIKKFAGFNSITDHSITTKDSNGAPIKTSGSFRVQVINEKTTYSNKYLSKPFENVMHWQISASGFANVPAQNGLLFKNIEWFFNTRPVMIPQINITGDLSSFLKDDSKEVGELIGDVEINLVVMKNNTD
jgi:hypothetical protein